MKNAATRHEATGVHRTPRRRRNRRTSKGTGTAVQERVGSTARRVLPWLVAGVGLAALAAVAHFGWVAACTADRLRIATIDLVGNVRVPDREVRAYTSISIGDSILRSNLDAAALNLRRHPWIRTARVQRHLPDRIVIELEEHQPEVVVALAEPYLANADGELFKRLSARDDVVLPVVTGVGREQAARDPDAVAGVVREAIALAEVLRRDGLALGRIDELHWDRNLGWSVVTRPTFGQRPLRTHLGLDARARVSRAASALESLKRTGRWPEELWVDGGKHPRRAHARLGSVESRQDKPLIAKAR